MVKPGEWQTTRIWRGTLTDCYAFAGTAIIGASGLTINPENPGPMATIEATYSNPQDGTESDDDNLITTVWSLVGNDLERPLLTHSKFVALSAAEQILIRKFQANPETVVTDVVSADGILFLKELREGTNGYPLSQYVLRRTQTIDPAWSDTVDTTNVGKYYATTATLTAAETIPATIKFTMDEAAWLKRTPTVTQQNNGKFEATQEWWGAPAWSALLYDLAT